MLDKNIPDIVIGRLPVYLRSLQRMHNEGRQVTSSQELGERLGISAAQIRKDLSQFGEFGKQGTGYNIEYLAKQIQEILHVDRVWDVALVGAGDMGHALASYNGFNHRGFEIKVIFDNDPEKIGTEISHFTVLDSANLKEVIQKEGYQVAMLAVPAAVAQDVVNELVEAGIKAVLNYAPVNLNVPLGVHVQHIDPAIHLQRMTYYLE
jgi:redox-sensing transcriptional repressor